MEETLLYFDLISFDFGMIWFYRKMDMIGSEKYSIVTLYIRKTDTMAIVTAVQAQ